MSLELGGGPQRIAQGASATPAWLEITKTIVEISGTIVTAIAVIIGGGWVYYKFFKERTYYPRIDISISGQARFDRQLHLRVTLKNIGTSRIDLRQKGTALILSHQDTTRNRTLEARWIERGAFSIFPHRSWIEPGELTSYDLLLNVSTAELPAMLTARVVCREVDDFVAIWANSVIWPDDNL